MHGGVMIDLLRKILMGNRALVFAVSLALAAGAGVIVSIKAHADCGGQPCGGGGAGK
jgi:hypothetical protein